MSFDIYCTYCGLCCRQQHLCEKCEISTMRANGLDESMVPEIRGLSKIWNGDGQFRFSDLYDKLKKLVRQRIEQENPYL